MTIANSFNLLIVILMAAYATYSWYWQASLAYAARYRYSSIVWAVVFVWIGFSGNYLTVGDSGLAIFVALFMVISIVDGFSGITKTRLVVSGYFKRTIPIKQIRQVTIVNVPNRRWASVICIFKSERERQYLLRFSGDLADVIQALKAHLGDVGIEVQSA